jgi:hypothetical protein
MTRLFVCCTVLLSAVSLYAQKTRITQELPDAKPGIAYPLTMHVYGLHIRPDWKDNGYGYAVNIVFADVVTNQRKLELRCSSDIPERPYRASALSVGDFSARVLKGGSGQQLGDEYELLLANRKVLGCLVSGISE